MPYVGIPIAQKGAPGGVASLAANGRVPLAQLPTDLGGDGEFRILDVWQPTIEEMSSYQDLLTRNVSISGLTNGSVLLFQSYVTVESDDTAAELEYGNIMLAGSFSPGDRVFGEARTHWDFGNQRMTSARYWSWEFHGFAEHAEPGNIAGSWTAPLRFLVDGWGDMTLAYAHVIVSAWRPS